MVVVDPADSPYAAADTTTWSLTARPRGNDSVASGALSIDALFVLGLRSSHPNRKVS